jgi:peptidyl-prolyl cis-trans isomerase D
VDASGRDKAGNPVNLPEAQALLRAAFASDIGVDNEPLRLSSGGYVWYDVTGIEPSRDRPLDEVRNQVAAQWREDQVAQRLAEKARQLAERLDSAAIEALGQEAGAPVRTAADLARNAAKEDLTAEAVNRIFSVPVGKAGHAPNGPEGRVVFKVASASVPPFITTTQEAERLDTQLRNAMGDDLLNQYTAQVRQNLGVTINPQALRQATGGDL